MLRTTRRGRRRRAALLAALAAVLCACGDGGEPGESSPDAAGSAKGYNLLLISMDTTRADRLGAYGYDAPTTPHLDALAARGVLFEQCIARAPGGESAWWLGWGREWGFT